jgi:hypothetical protein
VKKALPGYKRQGFSVESRAIAFGFKLLSDCHSEEQSDEESRCMQLNHSLGRDSSLPLVAQNDRFDGAHFKCDCPMLKERIVAN